MSLVNANSVRSFILSFSFILQYLPYCNANVFLIFAFPTSIKRFVSYVSSVISLVSTELDIG